MLRKTLRPTLEHRYGKHHGHVRCIRSHKIIHRKQYRQVGYIECDWFEIHILRYLVLFRFRKHSWLEHSRSIGIWQYILGHWPYSLPEICIIQCMVGSIECVWEHVRGVRARRARIPIISLFHVSIMSLKSQSSVFTFSRLRHRPTRHSKNNARTQVQLLGKHNAGMWMSNWI